jgi:hypothetical protein
LILKIADRANSCFFLNKKTNPEKREKSYQKNREDNPAGGRNLPRDARVLIAAAARAMKILIQCRRLLKGLQTGVGRGRLLLKIRERLHAVDGFILRRLGVRNLVLVRFPRIRTRRRVFVICRRGIRQRIVIIIIVEILHRRKFRPAKTTEIAGLRVELTTILTMHIFGVFLFLKFIPTNSIV